MAVGSVQDVGSYWVDAAPFRAQLHHLMGGTALSAGEVAVAAGISSRLGARLAYGRNGRALRRIDRESALRLMALTVPWLRQWAWQRADDPVEEAA